MARSEDGAAVPRAEPGVAAPGSPGASSMASWAVPSVDMAGAKETLKKEMSADLKLISDQHGGPAQHLQSLTTQEKQDFIDHLWEHFPEKDYVLYHYGEHLPPVLAN